MNSTAIRIRPQHTRIITWRSVVQYLFLGWIFLSCIWLVSEHHWQRYALLILVLAGFLLALRRYRAEAVRLPLSVVISAQRIQLLYPRFWGGRGHLVRPLADYEAVASRWRADEDGCGWVETVLLAGNGQHLLLNRHLGACRETAIWNRTLKADVAEAAQLRTQLSAHTGLPDIGFCRRLPKADVRQRLVQERTSS